jgi:hypothetical protein
MRCPKPKPPPVATSLLISAGGPVQSSAPPSEHVVPPHDAAAPPVALLLPPPLGHAAHTSHYHHPHGLHVWPLAAAVAAPAASVSLGAVVGATSAANPGGHGNAAAGDSGMMAGAQGAAPKEGEEKEEGGAAGSVGGHDTLGGGGGGHDGAGDDDDDAHNNDNADGGHDMADDMDLDEGGGGGGGAVVQSALAAGFGGAGLPLGGPAHAYFFASGGVQQQQQQQQQQPHYHAPQANTAPLTHAQAQAQLGPLDGQHDDAFAPPSPSSPLTGGAPSVLSQPAVAPGSETPQTVGSISPGNNNNNTATIATATTTTTNTTSAIANANAAAAAAPLADDQLFLPLDLSTGGPLPPQLVIPGSNPDLGTFVFSWARAARHDAPGLPYAHENSVLMRRIEAAITVRSRGVRRENLDGNRCDMQGIDWAALGVSRRAARRRRLETYHNYTNVPDSALKEQHVPPLMRSDSFFRFQKSMIRGNTRLSHFQLRSLLACPTRTQAFYPGINGVYRLDTSAPLGGTSLAISLRDTPDMNVTTLDARFGVLVAGCFTGEYLLRPTDTDADPRRSTSLGTVSDAHSQSSITNHLQLYQPRRSGPAVAFSSNDAHFRSMDVATQRFTLCRRYAVPMNCSAMSPDQRLRVMVGDQKEAIIVDAESGAILQSLAGHHDYGFSCDWSQDGHSVATGFQDKTVKIWDARRWGTPVETLRSEMAGVRALRFSPLGSGARVLAAAEEADFVNVIEARMFQSKQTFDLFGEIGGLAFSNEGNDLSVLLCDRLRGGVVRFEQAGIGFDWCCDNYGSAEQMTKTTTVSEHDGEGSHASLARRRWTPASALRQPLGDVWSNYSAWDEGAAVNMQRRAAVLDQMEPF